MNDDSKPFWKLESHSTNPASPTHDLQGGRSLNLGFNVNSQLLLAWTLYVLSCESLKGKEEALPFQAHSMLQQQKSFVAYAPSALALKDPATYKAA